MISLLYMMYNVSVQEGIESLPWENKAMAGMFVRTPSNTIVFRRD